MAWRAAWVSRLFVWVVGMAAVVTFGTGGNPAKFDPAGLMRPFGPLGDLLIGPAARWDAVWYTAIAQHGYDGGASSAFFPLYPLLMRGGGGLVGSPLLAGALLSFGAFVAALALLHRLAALELGERAAGAAVALTALFPMSFFFSAAYSESLFLALSLGAVLAAREGRWAWAGVAGALAAATRSAGVVVLLPLAVLYLWGPRADGPGALSGGRLSRDALWLALVPAGLAAVLAYHGLAWGDALGPLRAQDVWHRHFAGPFGGAWDGTVAAWDGARQLLSASRGPVYFPIAVGDPFAIAGQNLMLFGFLVYAVVAVAGALRRLPAAYGLYAVAALALPLSWPVTPQPLMSLPRFVAVLFPCQLWLAAWAARDRRRLAVALGVGAALLALFVAQFSTWRWVA